MNSLFAPSLLELLLVVELDLADQQSRQAPSVFVLRLVGATGLQGRRRPNPGPGPPAAERPGRALGLEPSRPLRSRGVASLTRPWRHQAVRTSLGVASAAASRSAASAAAVDRSLHASAAISVVSSISLRRLRLRRHRGSRRRYPGLPSTVEADRSRWRPALLASVASVSSVSIWRRNGDDCIVEWLRLCGSQGGRPASPAASSAETE